MQINIGFDHTDTSPQPHLPHVLAVRLRRVLRFDAERKACFNGDTGSGGDATGEEGVRDGAQLGSNDGTPRPAYVGTGTHAAECGGMTEEGHGA